MVTCREPSPIHPRADAFVSARIERESVNDWLPLALAQPLTGLPSGQVHHHEDESLMSDSRRILQRAYATVIALACICCAARAGTYTPVTSNELELSAEVLRFGD